LESVLGEQFKAEVILPHSINIAPRRIPGRFAWKSQMMATKDAALRAYARLNEAGLINDNLLPNVLPDPVVPMPDIELEEEESLVCVRSRMNPWTRSLDSRGNPYRQLLSIRTQFSGEEELPRLYLLVPETFDISMAFKMFWTDEQCINVEISPESLVDNIRHDQDFHNHGLLATRRLLESVFLGKMHMQTGVPKEFPLLVVPFLESGALHDWLAQCTGDMLVGNFDGLGPEQGLIRLKNWSRETRPYIFRSSVVKARESQWIDDSTGISQPKGDELHFEVKRLPKRLDYLHPPNYKDFNNAVELVPAAECYVDRFPTIYAKLMLLLPSILHRLELRAVAAAFSRNILTSINFRHVELVENAICSSAANERTNYQRLELIGDTILKFWTSAQLSAQFPGWHEGYLSKGKDRVVSNSHLCQVAKIHGLDEYIHTVPFAGSRWRPPTIVLQTRDEATTPRRKISRKVLADVVEALIGAAFLDGKDEEERAIKVKACLSRFLDSVSWRTPIDNATILKNLVPNESPAFDNFSSLTEITGFSFDNMILLIEALTHPSHPPVGIQGSYQRLEFLGDSILDFVVVETMARHSRELPHFTMHLIRSAVVNAHLLAFFCLGSGFEHDRAQVTTDASSGKVDIQTTKSKTYLWEFMKHSGRLDLLYAQKACAKRYEELNIAINAALDHDRSHPWYFLLSLHAEKFLSDIIESILGAIFIDSNGNLEACKEFLERLGLLGYLRRILAENIDVMHPKERLGIVAGNSKVRYEWAKETVDASLQYSCSLFVDDEMTATSAGEVSRAAAETKAAQNAVGTILRKRCVNVGERDEEMKK
jgi:dsRNA-specific ribonuclease